MLFAKNDLPSLNRPRHSAGDLVPESGPPHTILTIFDAEDDSRSFDVIARQLRWEHHPSRTLPEALVLLRKHRFSAIVLDQALWGTAERSVMDASRQPDYSPKLILARRFSEGRDVGAVADDGVFHWLWKPFRKDEVRQALGFALSQCQREWEQHQRNR